MHQASYSTHEVLFGALVVREMLVQCHNYPSESEHDPRSAHMVLSPAKPFSSVLSRLLAAIYLPLYRLRTFERLDVARRSFCLFKPSNRTWHQKLFVSRSKICLEAFSDLRIATRRSLLSCDNLLWIWYHAREIHLFRVIVEMASAHSTLHNTHVEIARVNSTKIVVLQLLHPINLVLPELIAQDTPYYASVKGKVDQQPVRIQVVQRRTSQSLVCLSTSSTL